jgi:hypothetical protein
MAEGNAGSAAAEALEDLLGTFRSEAEATRTAVAAHEASRRRQNQWALAIIAVMAVLMAMVLVLLLQSRQKSEQGREILRRNAAVSQQIADCTTNRASACYQEGQKRSAEAIAKLTAGLTAAIEEIAVCNKTTTTEPEQRACVDRALAKIAKAQTAP